MYTEQYTFTSYFCGMAATRPSLDGPFNSFSEFEVGKGVLERHFNINRGQAPHNLPFKNPIEDG